MNWIRKQIRYIEEENFLTWFIAPPRVPTLKEMKRTHANAERT